MKIKKGYSLIELLISLGIIGIISLSIFIINKVQMQNSISDVIEDVFYSNTEFKEMTAFSSNIKYSGEQGKFFIKSKFPPIDSEKANHASTWYGQHYFKNNLGMSIIQRNNKDTLTYTIILNEKSKTQEACIKLTNYFLRNENIDQEASLLSSETFENISSKGSKIKNYIADSCKPKKDKDITLVLHVKS